MIYYEDYRLVPSGIGYIAGANKKILVIDEYQDTAISEKRGESFDDIIIVPFERYSKRHMLEMINMLESHGVEKVSAPEVTGESLVDFKIFKEMYLEDI